jgi:hypothetical protein
MLASDDFWKLPIIKDVGVFVQVGLRTITVFNIVKCLDILGSFDRSLVVWPLPSVDVAMDPEFPNYTFTEGYPLHYSFILRSFVTPINRNQHNKNVLNLLTSSITTENMNNILLVSYLPKTNTVYTNTMAVETVFSLQLINLISSRLRSLNIQTT